MRKRSRLARAARSAHRAGAGRRPEACAPDIVVPAGSPDRLCRTLSERIPRMARHHRAVAELAATLAGRIGLHGEDLHAVVRAAELHDVGKVFVPDTILDKPGKLSADELELMRRHAIGGWLILHESAEPDPIAAARALLARALGRHRLPRRPERRRDPARRSHHHDLRRLRRDDPRPALPAGALRWPRPSRSCAGAPACATTRPWSPSSSRPSRRRPTGRRA